MKIIEVVVAILQKDSQILVTQRGYGEFEGKWEFPGGKIEEGETAHEALKREIKEELDIEIVIEDLFDTIEYKYPQFEVKLQCFLCRITDGEIVLKEHQDARWLGKENVGSVDWLPANMELIDRLKKSF